ncbi:hypothetical protein PENFLA_c015G00733 [Penicillium flavigenum]|uniref:Uncharacterized protein n=1 Tax=Penicillium flavigenum TaxID=254877 RepID=A0A1V6T3V6_9EURO|nr:hypothetical protein PENFLA_c015G00733 [Penicillium flavigenum]
MSTVTNVRAALGQLIGHEAPHGEACAPYQKGNRPFASCRIVFLVGSGFQWSLSCACCQWSSAANKCTLHSVLVYDLVRRFQPASILLKAPNMLLHANGQTRADKKKADKGKGEAVSSGKASAGPAATPPAKDKGKGKAGQAQHHSILGRRARRVQVRYQQAQKSSARPQQSSWQTQRTLQDALECCDEASWMRKSSLG